MKNYIFSLCVCCLTGLFFTSCEYIKQLEDKPEDRITVFNDDHKNIAFTPAESTIEINIISNVEWTSSSNGDWCRAEPSSGDSGNKKVLIVADKNMDSETRSAKITFTAGTAELVINVMQPGLQSRSFTITHGADKFALPVFTGVYAGTVDWGDKVVEDVMSAEEHMYSKSGEKKISFDLLGEENSIQVEIHGIKDVLRVDFSGLRK